MIIGVTGLYAAGKDTLAEYLEKRQGFVHYSLSDEIREECRKRQMKMSRDNMISLANELRRKEGPGVFAARVKAKLEANKDYVLTSIRNPVEIDILKKIPDFVLINIDADVKNRFSWIQRRAREGDPETLAELEAKEKQEKSSDPNKQQLHKCIKLAKIVIKNDSSIEGLYEKVDNLLSDLRKRFHKRPSWDEYFMGIAQSVARRATCDRGRSGCVIARDKQIMVTGYVGSPLGVAHCDEIGHQMKATIHEDGHQSNHCVRTTHAEQNAICQAARRGIPIQGSTLYCRMTPCYVCAKMIINAGVVKVVAENDYHAGGDSHRLFKEAGIKLEILNKQIEKYSNQ
ncbi:hypothetical protein COV20_00720 [Candidatus Woesearchaeota archaeon CG10_big_fil_rev_8_21_14_0_10_45_16]|nr:MAG: hypothetical protein COV20_00720 [Candidatus Woesearchaeota archaeon CG10_big_fil_rev_8_21_14_0_10_45_16]